MRGKAEEFLEWCAMDDHVTSIDLFVWLMEKGQLVPSTGLDSPALFFWGGLPFVQKRSERTVGAIARISQARYDVALSVQDRSSSTTTMIMIAPSRITSRAVLSLSLLLRGFQKAKEMRESWGLAPNYLFIELFIYHRGIYP